MLAKAIKTLSARIILQTKSTCASLGLSLVSINLLLSVPMTISVAFLITMIELPYAGRTEIARRWNNKIYFRTLMPL